MGTSQNIQAWTKQANTVSPQTDTDAPWTETTGTIPQLNNYGRSNMSAVKKYAEDIGGGLVAGGTATALTVTSNQVISSGHIANGLMFAIRTASAATGAATLAVDGLTATTIKKNDSSAIAAGDWASGALLLLYYSSTASAFIAANVSPRMGQRASFSVNKNSSNQTGIATNTDTLLTWGTEVYDNGSFFASSLWTPPAGLVAISAGAYSTSANIDTGDDITISLYKNAASYKVGNKSKSVAASTTISSLGTWQDSANGTDTYGIWVNIGSSSGNKTVDGNTTRTWFMGSAL